METLDGMGGQAAVPSLGMMRASTDKTDSHFASGLLVKKSLMAYAKVVGIGI